MNRQCALHRVLAACFWGVVRWGGWCETLGGTEEAVEDVANRRRRGTTGHLYFLATFVLPCTIYWLPSSVRYTFFLFLEGVIVVVYDFAGYVLDFG